MDNITRRVQNAELLSNFSKHFSTDTFLPKFRKIAEKAGKEVAYNALLLYYVLIDSNVPISIRITIAGALGYLILPLDLIPDFIIGLGFTDDLAALYYVVEQVQAYRTPEIDNKVDAIMRELFY